MLTFFLELMNIKRWSEITNIMWFSPDNKKLSHWTHKFKLFWIQVAICQPKKLKIILFWIKISGKGRRNIFISCIQIRIYSVQDGFRNRICIRRKMYSNWMFNLTTKCVLVKLPENWELRVLCRIMALAKSSMVS